MHANAEAPAGAVGRIVQVRERPAFEHVFVVLALSLFSWALIPLLQEEAGFTMDHSTGNRLLQALNAPVYLLTGVFLLSRAQACLRILRHDRITVLLLLLSVASVAWSVAPEITLRRSIALLASTAFAYYLVCSFEVRTLLRLLAWTIGPAAVLSVFVAVLLPDLGIHQGRHAGAWQGIYPDKNSLGRIMVLGASTFALLAVEASKRRWMHVGGAALCTLLVFQSRSASALVVLLALSLLIPLFYTLRWHYKAIVPWLIGLVFVGGAGSAFLVAQAPSLLALMGKDTTFTGRTELWIVVLQAIQDRPWLGHGYSAFWTGWVGSAADVWSAVGWRPPHAHNGFLDLVLELGAMGLAVFMVGLVIALARGFRQVRGTASAVGLWPLVMIAFTILYNVSESTLLQQNNIFWILYVVAIGYAARQGSGAPPPPFALEPLPHTPLPAGTRVSLGVRRRVTSTALPASNG